MESTEPSCADVLATLWKSLDRNPGPEHPLLNQQPPPPPFTSLLFHILFTPTEGHPNPSLLREAEAIPTTHLYPLGITHTKSGSFIPVVWPAGQRWRTQHGMPYRPLYLALTPCAEGPETDASVSSLCSTTCPVGWHRIDGVPVPPWAGADVLDAVILDCRSRGAAEGPWILALLERYPEEERGWVRLGEWARSREWSKGVVGAFHAAILRCGDEKRRSKYEKHIIEAASQTEWSVWTSTERAELERVGSRVVEEELKSPWAIKVPEVLEQRTVETRTQQFVPMGTTRWWKLPRFFSWIVSFRLAGMSTPKSAEDINALQTLGVTQVLTLTVEQPLPREWFGLQIENTFIPTKNLFPPTVQQMDRAIRLIVEETERGGATLVHCGGGKGRAGTVLACYIALFGLSSPEGGTPPKMAPRTAMELLRNMRPGSIETEKQEKFVEKYVSLAWKRYGQGDPLYGNGGDIDEPVGLSLELTGDVSAPDVIALIGVQGSGKSTFSKMARLRNPKVVVVSPDEVVAEGDGMIGSATASKSCEDVVGRFRRSPCTMNGPDKLRRVLILDRCNATAEERKRWIALLTTRAKVIAIWFDYDPELCRARVESRPSHPTLPPWRSKSAIESVSKMLQPPSLTEGFNGIARVRSIDCARQLADQLFGAVQLQKFIRTRHLLDLGSATRDDLVLSPEDLTRCISQNVIVEEKVDGANLGISISASGELQVQNRSHYISSKDQAQFAPLPAWLERNAAALKTILTAEQGIPERYVLYGEWLVATHSIEYTHLPDWFMAFDLYDRLENRFLSRSQLEARLKGMGIPQVPVLYQGNLDDVDMLHSFLTRRSLFSPDELIEGVVVRFHGGGRGKVVRGDFVAGSRHWGKNEIRRNRVWREQALN
ncbi:hypothetical protein FN846DRAFT_321899 [Sphaerosporella brunnea]|uniref:Tyrosine specific protein phosphatases domain-containing protein n=1 Tax=Sphaerosporella brunnea TaxID=1250544 RepID=A0A5J5F6L7_9PEZI|nr:hypothetical protein FN846DRAFT_321899 [Sphaerosporella brunnea]